MSDRKMAVLIDAENVSGRYVKLILDEVSNYGTATYKRLYGDFQNSSVKAWMKNLQDYAITPVFQYNYTQGKNASDSALIIDAMDILYSGNVDGFCIVTSDSDFTKLVMRLRESGMTVLGMGERKTPNALVSACESFKFLDILYNDGTGGAAAVQQGNASEENASEASSSSARKAAPEGAEMPDSAEGRKKSAEAANGVSSIPDISEMEKEIISIINTNAGEDGWVDLSELGDSLPKRVPGFDPRNYNCSKLKQFIELFDSVEVRSARNPHNKILSIIYVRVKQEEEAPVQIRQKRKKRRRKQAGEAG
ncbi:NYN domain-containing protein [Otoolea muris]|uniref:NYN domain-containing protein n=1 Tax=Otoolea muris TaxID=2941515 RepID=UPI002041C26C|nr:NYN domain-containing protein [Otoolea muris]